MYFYCKNYSTPAEADLGMISVRPYGVPHKNGAPTLKKFCVSVFFDSHYRMVIMVSSDCICTDCTYALLNTVTCCVAFEKIDYKIRTGAQ